MRTITHKNPDGRKVEVTVGDGVRLGDDVTLGKGVTLGNGVRLADGVTVGDAVVLGDGVALVHEVKIGKRVTTRTAWSMRPHGARPVAIMRDAGQIAVGCEQHTVEYWRTVSDADLQRMDGERAVNLWHRYGPMVLAAYDATPEADPT